MNGVYMSVNKVGRFLHTLN